MMNPDEYIRILEETKLTQQQLLFLYLHHNNRFDLLLRYMELYPSEDGTVIGSSNARFLIDEGYIESVKDGDMSDSYVVTDKFSKYYVNHEVAYMELLTAYPKNLVINGRIFPLTYVNRDIYEMVYWKRINGLLSVHQEIIELIQWGKENSYTFAKLDKFIDSTQWIAIKEVKDIYKEGDTFEYEAF